MVWMFTWAGRVAAHFARDGFHQTSMADILRQSGLSAGAVYSYFSGKEEIIAAVAEDRHRQEAELNEAAAGAADPVAAPVRSRAGLCRIDVRSGGAAAAPRRGAGLGGSAARAGDPRAGAARHERHQG